MCKCIWQFVKWKAINIINSNKDISLPLKKYSSFCRINQVLITGWVSVSDPLREQLREHQATSGSHPTEPRSPRTGTQFCRPGAVWVWRCQSLAVPSRIDTAEQLHPAAVRREKVSDWGPEGMFKGKKVSADTTFVLSVKFTFPGADPAI